MSDGRSLAEAAAKQTLGGVLALLIITFAGGILIGALVTRCQAPQEAGNG